MLGDDEVSSVVLVLLDNLCFLLPIQFSQQTVEDRFPKYKLVGYALTIAVDSVLPQLMGTN